MQCHALCSTTTRSSVCILYFFVVRYITSGLCAALIRVAFGRLSELAQVAKSGHTSVKEMFQQRPTVRQPCSTALNIFVVVFAFVLLLLFAFCFFLFAFCVLRFAFCFLLNLFSIFYML
jgi:hypothetical protein